MDPIAAEWARRGYVTLSIDYRLDPGNRCQDIQDGKITDPALLAVETARCKRAIEAAQADALASIAWLRLHATTYRVDPLRVAVGGSSAGAVTAVNVAERANPLGGPITARYRVGAALAMSGCNYDPASIDAYDRPIALLASGHDQAVDFGCVTTTADTAQAKGNVVQRTFYPNESAHAMTLYRAHQATVDAKWTKFLIAQLHL
jgi:dienelactone hydrolase